MTPALSEDDCAGSHERDRGRFPRLRLGARQIRTLTRTINPPILGDCMLIEQMGQSLKLQHRD